MKAIGLIVEYNPFHNGHLYHLQTAKKMYEDHIVVVVMSGTFMQRGEPSIIDKWKKTEIALEYGADLVIELPFPFATSSADLFAKGSVGILNHLKVDHLLFGSESGNIDELIKKASEKELDIKKYLKEGYSYPKAISLASVSSVDQPNDILGLSYIREIHNLNSSMKPNTIKRTNDYHSKELTSNIASATSIRKAILEKKEISNFIPNKTLELLNNIVFIEDFYPFLKYKIISEINNLEKYNLVDEGIENRIKKFINNSNSLDELIMNVKSKRFTYSKLRRMFTHILCSYTKDENKRNTDIRYIRILGFSNNGARYIKSIKKDVEVPIISNYSKLKDEMLDIEMRATSIYEMISKNNLIEKEYKNNAKNTI